MALEETNISKKIQMAACKVGARLLRNNTGLFWSLDKKRKMRAGLGSGTSDLIGWTQITITPEMVGKVVAVYTAIEVKAGKNNTQENQDDFITAVLHAGGIAGAAWNEDDAISILKHP